MGCDTYAMRREARTAGDPPTTYDAPGAEIAYLRGRYGIFEAFDAIEFDAKVSGDAGGKWVGRAELETALRRVVEQDSAWQAIGNSGEPAVGFVRECIDRFPPEDDRIYIWFC